jgi:vacuolar protein sorting-associated protein VTA1
MSTGIPEIPPPLRPIAHYTKISNEYKERDVVIYYWCLYHAVQEGMRLDKSSPAALNFLTSALSSLESIKKANAGNEALTNDVVAQAHIESHALRLFNYADSQDRSSVFNKNIVKAFYTSGHLLDVLTNFGELDDNLQSARKYAKWKATYIHNCLKNGETPVPGPPGGETSAEDSLDQSGMPGNKAEPENTFDLGLPAPPTSNMSNNAFVPPPPHEYQTTNFPAANVAPQRPPVPVPRSSSSMAAQLAQVKEEFKEPLPAANLSLEHFLEAKKYTKYALSALDYDDPKTAIENMYKAIGILQQTTH